MNSNPPTKEEKEMVLNGEWPEHITALEAENAVLREALEIEREALLSLVAAVVVKRGVAGSPEELRGIIDDAAGGWRASAVKNIAWKKAREALGVKDG